MNGWMIDEMDGRMNRWVDEWMEGSKVGREGGRRKEGFTLLCHLASF